MKHALVFAFLSLVLSSCSKNNNGEDARNSASTTSAEQDQSDSSIFTNRPNIDGKEYDFFVASVNGDMITESDLRQNISLALLSSGEKANPSEHLFSPLGKTILKEMIYSALKKQCIKKFEPRGGWISKQEVMETVTSIAANNNMTLKEFESYLAASNVKWQVFYNKILESMSWNVYIKARYGYNATISSYELSSILSSIKSQKDKPSCYVCRIFIPVLSISEDRNAKSQAENLLSMLRNRQASFGALARQFSKAPEAIKGGELGWVFDGQLAQSEAIALNAIEIGEYTIAKSAKGYSILYLKDRRDPSQKSFKEVRFVQAMLPFAHNATDFQKMQLLQSALAMRSSFPKAKAFIDSAKSDKKWQVSNEIVAPLLALHKEFARLLEQIKNGTASEPIATPNGILIICLLDLSEKEIKDPTLREIKEQKMSEKFSLISGRDINDLKKKAQIEINKKYGSVQDFID